MNEREAAEWHEAAMKAIGHKGPSWDQPLEWHWHRRAAEHFRRAVGRLPGDEGAHGLLHARLQKERAEADVFQLLEMLAARPDITSLFGFKEKAIFESVRTRYNDGRRPDAEADYPSEARTN